MRIFSPYIIVRFAALLIFCCINGNKLLAQQAFDCLGQMFVVTENGESIISLSINPGNNAINQSVVTPVLPNPLSCLGFRRTDGFLYGIGSDNQRLYRIGATGTQEEIGVPALSPGLNYLAGEISPDGRYFVLVGSDAADVEIVKIDLDNNFNVQAIPISSSNLTTDISFDPHSGQLFGFDSSQRRAVRINADNGSYTGLQTIGAGNEIEAVFFNAFGDLKAFGNTLNGVVSAIFNVDKVTGNESLFTTTGLLPLVDFTACPYRVDIRNEVNPQSSFPCSEIDYTYQIANATQEQIDGVNLTHILSDGIDFLNISQNPYGGTVNIGVPPNTLEINGMNLSTGVKNIGSKVEIMDIPGGNYSSKATLENLPLSIGGNISSDNPNTNPLGDSTTIQINRFEEDSIYFSAFICLGETATLDASDFGNNITWYNGNTQPTIQVSQQGVYSLVAESGCQNLIVSYEVVTASCPFTISLGHSIIPDTIFPCSNVVFRYYLDNDSGLERFNVGFLDTLPGDFTLVDIPPNIYGGTIIPNAQPNVVEIQGMTMPQGLDSFDVIVNVGDVDPGSYFNQAEINNLPIALGEKRFSFDPNTQLTEETKLEILGVDSDTSFVDTVVCSGETILLDASPFGTSFTWPDGSSEAVFAVNQSGLYDVEIFDGCEPSLVYFNVVKGAEIQVSINSDVFEINQGDSIQLLPTIVNGGDSLSILWLDLLQNTLSCTDCAAPVARPLESTIYTLFANNELCGDSLTVVLNVDDTRRIYAPTVFSPNDDGINDFYYLQSPDPAIIHSFKIASRWGEIIFDTEQMEINIPQTGWNGSFKDKRMDTGVYIWMAELEFIDGSRKIMSGDFLLIK
ncbi:MAG: gliding motility-associated C-terminal domain-containing protein [Bacteroidota bacterium]